MCCREGVDKAPKAPKTSSVSTASLIDSSHLSGPTGRKRRGANTKNSLSHSAPKNKHEAIEMIDLAGGQAAVRSDKTLPKAFRSLNSLHENVTKGRTAAMEVERSPIDREKGSQLQTSPLSKDASPEISSEKSSTDYDTGWMGELPSPSVLLRKSCEELGPSPEHISPDHVGSWPDDFPPLSAPISPNDAATGVCGDSISLEGFDTTVFSEHDSEIEAAMVGLSDSVSMQEDPQVQVATGQTRLQADGFQHRSLPPDDSTHRPNLCPTAKVHSPGTSRLFFSTESPEKEAELGQKRKAGVSDEAESLSQSAPVPKRLRVSDGSDQAQRPSSNAARQPLPLTAVVKPGQPAWVYEIDPAFIAEWQDIVDFV